MKATARRVGFATPEPETVPLQKKHAHSDPTELGLRIRDLRLRKSIALRELAKRANVSPSLLSQIERGKSAPSVKTVYALVAALDVPIAQVFEPRLAPAPSIYRGSQDTAANGLVQLGDARRSIALEHGFRWECLTPKFDPNASFIELIIEVGGGAEPEIEMKTHPGKEFGVVLKGRLGIAVAFDTYILNPRDSISFNSDIPHSMWNAGHEPMHAIWFEFGRIPQTQFG
jgi:transcriptional regulator with XRE-family HTH domain